MISAEINVINLIKSSHSTREYIAGLLGTSANREMLIRQVPKQETLATLTDELVCMPEEVFDVIHEELQESTERLPLPPFTFEHLHLLATGRFNGRLSRLLNCDPGRVLDTLFNPQIILRIIYEFNPNWLRERYAAAQKGEQAHPVMDIVFLQLLARREEIKAHFEINDFEWERLIDEQQWFSDYALQQLQANAIKLGYAPQKSARLLAAALNTNAQHNKPSHDMYLDALGILEIKHRVDWIIRQLREQVQESMAISEPVQSPSPPSILQKLQAVIEYYEINAPAAAWRSILHVEKTVPPPLRDSLTSFDIRSTKASGTPQKEAHLQVRSEAVWSTPGQFQFWKKKELLDNQLIVSCRISEQNTPVDILICHQVAPEQVPTLSSRFTAIRGQAIATGYMDDLGEQLLNTSLVSEQPPTASLRNAAQALLPEIIRGLVLTGAPLPVSLPAVWNGRLRPKPPITSISSDMDTTFPQSRADIYRQLKEAYTGDDNLQLVI